MTLWQEIESRIAEATGRPVSGGNPSSVGGGCINAAYVLQTPDRRYFVKLNDAARQDMFAAEAEGLQEIHRAGAVRAPRPLAWGEAGGRAFIAMEYLELGGGDRRSAEALGRQLAQMHRFTAPRFGWHRDNTIGSTPQINTPADDWLRFYRDRRLGYQLELAARGGHGGRLQQLGERLRSELGALLDGHAPAPALLHGDLWGGNFASTREGEPVIFDPAVYYGDREADLAMTELFGGFPPAFYAAYREHYPLDAGYGVRKKLYNLYHVLNHLNLFGGGYRGQAEGLMAELLAELR